MTEKVCPVTGLPVRLPETFYGQAPGNNYRTEHALLGDRILLLKAGGYGVGSDMKKALANLDRYLNLHVGPESRLIAIEDYSSVKGVDAEARKTFFEYYQSQKIVTGGVIYGVPPLFRLSYHLGMLTGAIKRRTYLVDDYPQAVKTALKLAEDPSMDPSLPKGSKEPRRRRPGKWLLSFFSRRKDTSEEFVPRSWIEGHVEETLACLSDISRSSGQDRLDCRARLSPDNPFLPLFDMAAYIRSDLEKELEKRKSAEAALIASEAQTRRIIEKARAGIYEIDFKTNKLKNVNDLIVEATGYSKAELLNMEATDILTEESREIYWKRVEKINQGIEVPQSPEFKIRTKDGAEKWMLLNPLLNLGTDGLPESASVVVTDITRLKQTEEKLKQYQEKLLETSLALSI